MTIFSRDIPKRSGTHGESHNNHLLEFGDLLKNISIDVQARQLEDESEDIITHFGSSLTAKTRKSMY